MLACSAAVLCGFLFPSAKSHSVCVFLSRHEPSAAFFLSCCKNRPALVSTSFFSPENECAVLSFCPCPERPSPPPPQSLVQTPHLKSKSTRVVNTTSQLISSHYSSSHPCRSSNSSPPSAQPTPFLVPAQFVQTPHLQSKSARVINTSKQLVSRQYLSSHP